jgi:hypothetical protein
MLQEKELGFIESELIRMAKTQLSTFNIALNFTASRQERGEIQKLLISRVPLSQEAINFVFTLVERDLRTDLFPELS